MYPYLSSKRHYLKDIIVINLQAITVLIIDTISGMYGQIIWNVDFSNKILVICKIIKNKIKIIILSGRVLEFYWRIECVLSLPNTCYWPYISSRAGSFSKSLWEIICWVRNVRPLTLTGPLCWSFMSVSSFNQLIPCVLSLISWKGL